MQHYSGAVRFLAVFLAFYTFNSYAENTDVVSYGFALTSQIWPTSQIPVCWVNPTAVPQFERDWVRAAAVRTWENNSKVRFVGWSICPAQNDFNSIRIKIEDVGPYVVELGMGIRNYAEGMLLNFSFLNWSPICNSTEQKRQFCIEAIAVHEFGHALGFAHEQNRPDTPVSCTEPAQGADGNLTIGAWDLNSVMNYCNPQWNGDGNLSATDILTVQTFYGKPRNNPATLLIPIIDVLN